MIIERIRAGLPTYSPQRRLDGLYREKTDTEDAIVFDLDQDQQKREQPSKKEEKSAVDEKQAQEKDAAQTDKKDDIHPLNIIV